MGDIRYQIDTFCFKHANLMVCIPKPPLASFTKEINRQLAKCPLKTNGRVSFLHKRGHRCLKNEYPIDVLRNFRQKYEILICVLLLVDLNELLLSCVIWSLSGSLYVQ